MFKQKRSFKQKGLDIAAKSFLFKITIKPSRPATQVNVMPGLVADKFQVPAWFQSTKSCPVSGRSISQAFL